MGNLLQNYLKKLLSKTPNKAFEEKISDQLALSLYFKGKGTVLLNFPGNILKQISNTVAQISELLRRTKKQSYEIYTTSLLAHANYIAGGYSQSRKKRRFYLHSINNGRRAFERLSHLDNDKLLTMRSIVASTIKLRDESSFLEVKNTAVRLLKTIPKENYIYGVYLYNTIANGMAIFKMRESQKIKELALKHFKNDLYGAHATELSDIRSELETVVALGIKKTQNLEKKIKRGIQIATEENYPRHLESMKKLAYRLLK